MDEFDRLKFINETVSRAKVMIGNISDIKNVSELVSGAVNIEASARLLAQNITTTFLISILSKRNNSSLAILNHSFFYKYIDPAIDLLNNRLVEYGLLETTYINTLQKVLSCEFSYNIYSALYYTYICMHT